MNFINRGMLAADFIYSGLAILQDDPPPNPVKLFGQFLVKLGEFLVIIAAKVLNNIPITREEIIDFFFKDTAVDSFNKWSQEVLKLPFFENTLWYQILLIFVSIAGFILVIKVGVYFYKLDKAANTHTNFEIIGGHVSGLTSPLTYIPLRFLPTSIVIIATPVVILVSTYFLYAMMVEFAQGLYGAETMGGVIYLILVDLLTFSNLFWLWMTLGGLIALFMFFIVEYLLFNIFLLFSAIYLMITAATYGDGASGFEVIIDGVLVVVKILVILLVMRLMFLLFPALVYAVPISVFSRVFWIFVWLLVIVITPVILWFVPKRLEHRVGSAAKNAINFYVNGDQNYVPRSDVIRGYEGIEITRTGGDLVMTIKGYAELAYSLVKQFS